MRASAICLILLPCGHAKFLAKSPLWNVGLGDIAQGAVLPAFANAKSNSELAGLISDDPKKLPALARLIM